MTNSNSHQFVELPRHNQIQISKPFPGNNLLHRKYTFLIGKLFTNQQMPRTPFILPLFAQTLSSYSGEFREI